jgi:hypothetical protein
MPGILLPAHDADQVRELLSQRLTAECRRCVTVGVEQLLVDVVTDGITHYCCGPKAAPNALVACYAWRSLR